MSTRRALAFGVLLVAIFAAGQAIVRSRPEPPVKELVPWEPYDRLGEPPYDRPVLLEFSADWCAPCRRLQVTVFRDPRFVELLRRHNLRPVRLEYTEARDLEFKGIMGKHGVKALPAMVVIRPDGKKTSAITGARDTDTIEYELGQAMQKLEEKLYWHDADFKPSPADDRVTVLNFGTSLLRPVEYRSDWRNEATPAFTEWANGHLNLVSDPTHRVEGASAYRRYRVTQVPTLVVLDGQGREIARFEGMRAVELAPAEIARIARERGFDVPDPPRPYAIGRPPSDYIMEKTYTTYRLGVQRTR